MHADWFAECAADDPLIVVPWNDSQDPTGACAFVDLRAHPAAVDSISEAEAHPPLMQALRALNASRSSFFTAKCDAWKMSSDEVTQLHTDLMLDPIPDPDLADLLAVEEPQHLFFAQLDSGGPFRLGLGGNNSQVPHAYSAETIGMGGDQQSLGAPELTFGFASYIDLLSRDRALFASFPRQEHLLRTLTRLAARLDHPHAAMEVVLRPAFVTFDEPRQGWAITLYSKALGASPSKAYALWSTTLHEAVSLLRRS